MVDRATNVVRARSAVEDAQELGAERLRPERDAVDAVLYQQLRVLRRDRLRVRLDGRLRGSQKSCEQPLERGGLGDRRGAAAEEDRAEVGREQVPLELELGEERLDVRCVLLAAADCRDEVAVAAAVGAE